MKQDFIASEVSTVNEDLHEEKLPRVRTSMKEDFRGSRLPCCSPIFVVALSFPISRQSIEATVLARSIGKHRQHIGQQTMKEESVDFSSKMLSI
jgi:hypothetical protein